MEADLQRHYGIDWNPAKRKPSFRRLAVLVRHMPADSVIRRIGLPVEEQEWTTLHSLTDDIRRATLAQITGEYPPPHHMNPLTPLLRQRAELEAKKAQRRRDESDKRLAERAARLAKRAELDDDFQPLRWLRADGTRT